MTPGLLRLFLSQPHPLVFVQADATRFSQSSDVRFIVAHDQTGPLLPEIIHKTAEREVEHVVRRRDQPIVLPAAAFQRQDPILHGSA